MVVSRQPISIVNLKSNTMKNTVQMYIVFRYYPSNIVIIDSYFVHFNIKVIIFYQKAILLNTYSMCNTNPFRYSPSG